MILVACVHACACLCLYAFVHVHYALYLAVLGAVTSLIA